MMLEAVLNGLINEQENKQNKKTGKQTNKQTDTGQNQGNFVKNHIPWGFSMVYSQFDSARFRFSLNPNRSRF